MKQLAAMVSAEDDPPPIQRPKTRKTPSSRKPPARTLIVCIEPPCSCAGPLLKRHHTARRAGARFVVACSIWLSLNVFWPLDWGMAPRLLAVLTTLPQAVTIVLAVLVLRRAAASRPRGSRTFASEGA